MEEVAVIVMMMRKMEKKERQQHMSGPVMLDMTTTRPDELF